MSLAKILETVFQKRKQVKSTFVISLVNRPLLTLSLDLLCIRQQDGWSDEHKHTSGSLLNVAGFAILK